MPEPGSFTWSKIIKLRPAVPARPARPVPAPDGPVSVEWDEGRGLYVAVCRRCMRMAATPTGFEQAHDWARRAPLRPRTGRAARRCSTGGPPDGRARWPSASRLRAGGRPGRHRRRRVVHPHPRHRRPARPTRLDGLGHRRLHRPDLRHGRPRTATRQAHRPPTRRCPGRRSSWSAGSLLSLAANLAQAERTAWGWLTAGTPAGAFLVAVSMLERRSSGRRPARPVPSSSPVPPSFGRPSSGLVPVHGRARTT